MFAIAVLGIGAAYVVVSMLVIWMTVSVARNRGRRAWLWGLGAAFVMYNLVFWDWLPTVYAHKYYCEKEAGFWVYKTLEQWKAENPRVMETLVANKGAHSKRKGDMENYTDTYFLNDRFNWVVKHNGQFLLNRWRHEQEVVDTKNNSVLARYVDFSTAQEQPQAGWSGWKFWLVNEHCSSGGRNDSLMWQFTENFLGAKK